MLRGLNWLLVLGKAWRNRQLLEVLGQIQALTWRQRTSLLIGLARDPRLPLRTRLAPLLVAAYIVSPIDLVPDFIPVLGQLDDVAFAQLVFRLVDQAATRDLVREHLARVRASG